MAARQPTLSFLTVWILSGLFFQWRLFSAVASYEFGKSCTPKENANLTCYVEIDGCGRIPSSDDAPGPPYDFRIYQAMLAVPSRDPTSYRLGMNFSWQPPYDETLFKIRGFEITIFDNTTKQSRCFSLLIDNKTTWSEIDRDRLPWFRFWTKDVLEFSRVYSVLVHSLPRASNNSIFGLDANYKSLQFHTPEHPEVSSGPVNCSGGYANGDANKWVAAFKTVQIFPFARKIKVEFIAAPPKYCFEAYELRLLKSHLSIVNSTTIRTSSLYFEKIGNISVAYGNFTFLNITPGNYDLAVVPIDRAHDGHCLCPLPSRICTCSQAVWPDIKLPEAERPVLPDPCQHLPPARDPFLCRSAPPITPKPEGWSAEAWLLFCLLSAAALAIAASAVFLRAAYKRYSTKGNILYAVPTSVVTEELFRGGPKPPRDPASAGALRILVIYARDCPAHEKAVESLVTYLSAKLGAGCSVRADYLCAREIAENKLDWALNSIRTADRILLVASYGSYARYEAKLTEPGSRLRRRDPGPLDDLFLLQTDLLRLDRGAQPAPTVVIARFSYTPRQFAEARFCPINGRRFEIPKHADAMVKWLRNDATNHAPIVEWQCKDDPSSEWRRLKQAAADAESFFGANPDWFEKYHVKTLPTQEPPPALVFDRVATPIAVEACPDDLFAGVVSSKDEDPLIVGDGSSTTSSAVASGSEHPEETESLLAASSNDPDEAHPPRGPMESSDSGICCEDIAAYADRRLSYYESPTNDTLEPSDRCPEEDLRRRISGLASEQPFLVR